jgi:hypothetical protein
MTLTKTTVKAAGTAAKQNGTAATGLRVRTAVIAGKVTMQDFHFVMLM